MSDSIYDFRRPFGHIPSAARPLTAHALGCACSVCWVHNYCDAILLFPCPALDLPSLAPCPNYYTFYDDTAQFLAIRKAVKRFNSARLLHIPPV